MIFEKRVYQHEFKLNDTDDSVVDYIRKHRADLHHISIHKMAEDLFVSPNAIMRTVKKLGYSGFSELKFSIDKEIHGSQDKSAEKRVLDRIPQNIVKSIDVLEQDSVDLLVDAMWKAEKILFAGIGDSIYFCELFGRSLRCMDRKVEYYTQIHDVEYATRNLQKGDLIIILSASGTPKRLIDIALTAKDKEATSCCITHYGNNPLSEVCDMQLCFWGEQRIVNGYNMTDRSGLMMAIRLICEEFWKRICV